MPGYLLLNNWSNGSPSFSGGPPTANAFMYVAQVTFTPVQ